MMTVSRNSEMKHGFTGCGAAKESREIDLGTKKEERGQQLTNPEDFCQRLKTDSQQLNLFMFRDSNY